MSNTMLDLNHLLCMVSALVLDHFNCFECHPGRKNGVRRLFSFHGEREGRLRRAEHLDVEIRGLNPNPVALHPNMVASTRFIPFNL